MLNDRASLKAIARRAMIERGFEPDYSPSAEAQVRQMSEAGSPAASRPFDSAQGKRRREGTKNIRFQARWPRQRALAALRCLC